MQLRFTVSDPVKFSMVRIVADAGVAARYDDHKVDGTGEQKLQLNLLRGTNEITLFGYSGVASNIDPKTSPQARLFISCNDEECGNATELIVKSAQSPQPTQPSAGTGTKPEGNVSIKSPTGTVSEAAVDSLVVVKKASGIKKVSVLVQDAEGNRVDYKPALDVITFDERAGLVTTRLKMTAGKNYIRVADVEKPTDKANLDLVEVVCEGAKCEKSELADRTPRPGQKGSIHINSPSHESIFNDTTTAPVGFRVTRDKDATKNVKTVFVKVLNNGRPIPQFDPLYRIPAADPAEPTKTYERGIIVNIAKGTNRITVFDPDRSDAETDAIEINCELGCQQLEDLNVAATNSLIRVENPAENAKYKTSFVDAYLTIRKPAEGEPIKKIKYYVLNAGKTVVNAEEVEAVEVKYEGDIGTVTIPIKFAAGANNVTFFDPDNESETNRTVSLNLKCEGSACAANFLIATVPSTSMNTRVIVGMEQVGASAAASETKPCLDFFYSQGILFSKLKTPDGKDFERDADGKPIKVPRFGTWGLIRFSTTPQQTASAAVFPSNFVNQVTDPTQVVDLVQSFDFLAGGEIRVLTGRGWNYTLIPGVKQQSRIFVTWSGGAISPLNPTRASAQVFRIPEENGAQRPEFERRFGEPPAGKAYVGFVPLERDRFYRQWYVGLRMKSLYCDNLECSRYKNSFPSILDFGFGQNEAVTGGRFRLNGKRAFVIRLDAFYPLPFRPSSFLYLYGSAVMKIGQGGPRIDNPLFLDTAPGEVQITSNEVFIPTADLQPSRLSRDYYKIGVGVNLTELFNRNKTKPE
ncbi:MAG TPA: hypothetical protein VGD61_16230 [Pyrinomonadaceae bacterium]